MDPKFLSDLTPIEDRRYVLQDRDGDYVERVEGCKWDTVKMFFVFTKDPATAQRFSYKDLWWKLATTCEGIQFSQGFAGGRAVRVA